MRAFLKKYKYIFISFFILIEFVICIRWMFISLKFALSLGAPYDLSVSGPFMAGAFFSVGFIFLLHTFYELKCFVKLIVDKYKSKNHSTDEKLPGNMTDH